MPKDIAGLEPILSKLRGMDIGRKRYYQKQQEAEKRKKEQSKRMQERGILYNLRREAAQTEQRKWEKKTYYEKHRAYNIPYAKNEDTGKEQNYFDYRREKSKNEAYVEMDGKRITLSELRKKRR